MYPYQEFARPWTPLTRGELLCWLGLLFYMANHIETRRHEYWKSSKSILTQFMGRNRWEQIHRFLSFNIQTVTDTETPGAPWFNKIEPLYSTIRNNCRSAITPSSWIAIDEAMVPATGRSNHLVKLPGKPIPEGFKAWLLGSHGGYIVDWLLHSPVVGTEYCERKKKRLFYRPVPLTPVAIAETFQVPVVLCERLKSLYPHIKWLVFLDNLFLTVDVAHILLSMHIGVMGTTRKSSAGFPKPLVNLKEINKALLYGGTHSIQEGHALYFA